MRKALTIAAFTAHDLLTFKEAMHYLRVSRSTLYRLMWSGKLPGYKVGSTWRFSGEDLAACISQVDTLVRKEALPSSTLSQIQKRGGG